MLLWEKVKEDAYVGHYGLRHHNWSWTDFFLQIFDFINAVTLKTALGV